jgi:hypothetical protein
MRYIEFLHYFLFQNSKFWNRNSDLSIFQQRNSKKFQPESPESKTESEFRFQWGSQKLELKIGIPNQAQGNDNVRAVRNQVKKAREIWARVGQILMAENTLPKVSTKFYKAVVQPILLYGSETWNLSTTTLARLEGFHIRAAYRMTEKHKPKKGPHHGWV